MHSEGGCSLASADDQHRRIGSRFDQVGDGLPRNAAGTDGNVRALFAPGVRTVLSAYSRSLTSPESSISVPPPAAIAYDDGKV